MNRKLLLISMVVTLAASTGGAFAQPVQITDDEGYSRLARWESHLDQRIDDGVRSGSLSSRRAWQVQKQLDDIEQHVLQAYYVSNNGIDPDTFRQYAQQLRQVGDQLRDRGFNEPGFDEQAYSGGGGYSGGGYSGGGGYPPPPSGGNYYQEGQYENQCQHGNQVAGTIFGALGGGLIGSAASHGNGAAVAGGVVLGGLLGNALSRDISCDDQHYAYSTYDEGLNGDLDRDYQWHHDRDYGTFRATREYYDHGTQCRQFHVVNYRDGQRYEHDGTACRQSDQNWHFE